ncbi:sigma-54-dependent transcriptional regulator [Taklimakanibacter deserti]|uniref:sigma-54-dependent transcriptional regulator n=1 Tax=Taklimakanibacter deserti TaxID=2267839 RepID=UPI000E64C5C7
MSTETRILVVEDDAVLRSSLAQWLGLNHFVVALAEDAETAVKLSASGNPDVVLSDVRMPGKSGIELLRSLRQDRPELPVVMLSGHADVPMAVEAMRYGAFDFLTKPYVPEQLVSVLRNAAEHARMRRRLQAFEDEAKVSASLEGRILGQSPAVQKLRVELSQLVDLPINVLLHGETGSGKEVAARALHDLSSRCKGPLVAINCAAIPADLIESELFGHEAGAFTGARAVRVGKFECANKGTLFLDEVDSMPLAVQAKLLRVLQEGRVVRLGSNKELAIDVHVVSATKVDLRELIEEGTFREDLYFRLIGAEVVIPPLRERDDDKLLLFRYFAKAMAGRTKRAIAELSPSELLFINSYHWPGNIREVKLLAERFALELPWVQTMEKKAVASRPSTDSDMRSLVEQTAGFEKQAIEEALARAGGSVTEAALLLQIPRRTLNEKLLRLKIDRTSYKPKDRP